MIPRPACGRSTRTPGRSGCSPTPPGYWWAPDGERLLVARVDSARVERWHLADPAEPAAPPRAMRYAAVGTANADVALWVLGLDGTRTEVGLGAFEYLVGAGWDAH